MTAQEAAMATVKLREDNDDQKSGIMGDSLRCHPDYYGVPFRSAAVP